MRSRRANVAGLLAGLATLGTHMVPKCADAAEPSASPTLLLHWSAPRECPRAEDVRDRVVALAGADLRDAEASAITTRLAEGYRVHIRVAGGARDVVASSCSLAADAAATVIAISLVPGLAEREDAAPDAAATPASAAPGPVSPPPSSPSSSPPVAAERATAASPRAARRPIVAAGIFGAVDRGTLPDVGLGAGFEIAFTPGRFRFEAEIAPWLASSATTATEASGAVEGGTFHLTTAAARACYAVLDARFTLAPCLGIALDHVSAEGSGVARTREGSSTFFAPAIGAAAGLHLTRGFALRALVEGEVPIGREQFVIVGGSAVHRPAAVALRAAIGPEVSF